MIHTTGMHGFEINTDASLIDPRWDEFVGDHDRQYALAISHFKSLVRGTAFDNEVVRLRVGKNGYYAQSKRFPAAFFGDATPPEVTRIDAEEARMLAWEAIAHYRTGEAQALTCIYTDSEPADIFFGYRSGHSRRRYEVGGVRMSLPLHLRVMVDAEEPCELIGARRGVLIYQRTSEGEHLVLRARGRRQPYAGFTQFAE